MEVKHTPLFTKEVIEVIAGFDFHGPEIVGFLWRVENPAFAEGVFVLPDVGDFIVLSFGERRCVNGGGEGHDGGGGLHCERVMMR